MSTSRLSDEEVARRAEETYQSKIRARVEAQPENVGKILVLDVISGDYEIEETGLAAARRLKARRPDAEPYALRIGFDAVYAFDGPLTPRKQ